MSSDPGGQGPPHHRGGAGRGRGRGRRGGARGVGRGARRDSGGRADDSQGGQMNTSVSIGRQQPRQDHYHQQSSATQPREPTGRDGRGRGRGRENRGPKAPLQEPGRSSLLPTPEPPPSSAAKSLLSNKTKNVVKAKNGEKGADVHTVSEVERIHFTKLLIAFREDGERDKVEFDSSLTNTERKFIHQLAGQLGLISKSTGKGEGRKIAVTKRRVNNQNTGASYDNLPVLKISSAGIDALHRHVTKFPPTRAEELESRDTGSSLVDAAHRDEHGSGRQDGGFDCANDDAAVIESLKQLGLGLPKQAAISVPSVKYIDWNRRRERHADFQRQKQSNPTKYQSILNSRGRLPAFVRQNEIIATVAANPVTIIQGGEYVWGNNKSESWS
jgi:hypothetical protein